jgi:hypothetical protein
MEEIYDKLSIDFDKYILNKHVESDPLTVKYIASRLAIDSSRFMTVDYSERGRMSEIEYRTLLEVANDKYKNDILNIANDIMRNMDLEVIRLKRKRAWNSFM